MFNGAHPPASAQERQVVPVITAEDAVQDNELKQINDHLVASDGRVDRMWTAVNANRTDIAGMQGEERVFFGILGVLISGSIVLQVKGKKSA